jgi:hypothetical protein
VSDAPKLSQPATEKRSFRGELEPRKEQAASAECFGAEGGSSSPGEKKSVFKKRKKKSKRRMERNAARMQSYVRRMVPLRVPGMETGEGEAFAFVCAVISGFQKTIRTIFEDVARVGQMQPKREENSAEEHQVAPAPPPSDRRRRKRRRKKAPEEPDSRESPLTEGRTWVKARPGGYHSRSPTVGTLRREQNQGIGGQN